MSGFGVRFVWDRCDGGVKGADAAFAFLVASLDADAISRFALDLGAEAAVGHFLDQHLGVGAQISNDQRSQFAVGFDRTGYALDENQSQLVHGGDGDLVFVYFDQGLANGGAGVHVYQN